ncbi:hypothetical protein BV20DRAFT_956696 [Pilatotrama ljubarskyi]|nr:hypothetical protein BV20DRAFT_956696 [Pilatotrama ljubarskyi]
MTQFHQRQLLESRIAILQRRGLRRHLPLFALLEPANMSDDEADSPVKLHHGVFRIILAAWQSDAFRHFLWALDAMYRWDYAHPKGRRRTPGNEPRARALPAAGGITEDGVAPIGLPRNCYDRAWLDALTPHVRKELEVQDYDYDFSL